MKQPVSSNMVKCLQNGNGSGRGRTLSRLNQARQTLGTTTTAQQLGSSWVQAILVPSPTRILVSLKFITFFILIASNSTY